MSSASYREMDGHWMQLAFEQAEIAQQRDDEVPIGAVVVDANGELLGLGGNRNRSEHDPSAHAEIVAMRAAGQKVSNFRFPGCTVYVTLEPCGMCAAAMVHARIARVVFAASDPKAGACGSVFDVLADARHNHHVEVEGGLMGEEAGRRLTNYFRQKRAKALLL